MTQALGFNIHLRYLKNPGKLIERLRPYDPSTLVIMVDDNEPGKEDQTQYIPPVAAAFPDALIVARVKHRMDGGFHTKPQNDPRRWVAAPDDFLNKWGHLGVDNMTLYALNEPDDGIDDKGIVDTEKVARLNDWFVETAEKAAERGVSICGPNFGKGVPAMAADGAWHPAFDPILQVLSKHRGLHFAGLHEYGPEDDPFHLGRYKAMLRRCDQLGLAYPRIVFTEFGVDKADSGDQKVNGYKSRGWAGTYYVNWQIDKLKRIYAPQIAAGIIVGLNTFSMGASSPEWDPFNVEEDEGYWSELTRAEKRGDLMPTKPIKQYMPKPDNARNPMTISTKNMRSLRSGAATYFNEEAIIPAGSVITWYDFPAVPSTENGKLLHWKWADWNGKSGWICSTDMGFEPVEALPHDPVPPVVTQPESPAEPKKPEAPAEPERKKRVMTITAYTTDAEWAQCTAIAMSALEALRKLAGLSDPIQAILPHIVIEDMSLKEGLQS